MLASQRRAHILGLVEESGAVRVSDLVHHLRVSDMTIRRDIERLDREGLLNRVHGGAVARAHRTSDEPGFSAKSGLMRQAKHAIAQAAAELVTPGSAIGISAGTTTFELARAVRHVPGLTVVTNSVPVAQLLHESGTPGQSVILTGGFRTPSDALVGPVAVAALRSLHVDRLFLGVHGLDLGAGLTTPNLVEAETNRALVGTTAHVCVLADHTKWGIRGLSTFADLREVEMLITDAGLPGRARAAIAEVVSEIVIAPLSTGPDTADTSGAEPATAANPL